MDVCINYSKLHNFNIIKLFIDNNEIYFRSLVNYLKIILSCYINVDTHKPTLS